MTNYSIKIQRSKNNHYLGRRHEQKPKHLEKNVRTDRRRGTAMSGNIEEGSSKDDSGRDCNHMSVCVGLGLQ